MYSNISPVLVASTTGLAASQVWTSPVWPVLGGFAVLAACSAVARIVPRRGTLPRA